jgi:two-component system, NtrC family, nitrogen regulation response regulator NtrX
VKPNISTLSPGAVLPGARALFEQQFLRRKLSECRGNVSLLAKKIGLERSHLYQKLKAYGLEPGKEEG